MCLETPIGQLPAAWHSANPWPKAAAPQTQNRQKCCARENRPERRGRRTPQVRSLQPRDRCATPIGRSPQDPEIAGEKPDKEKRHGEEVRQSCPPIAMTKGCSKCGAVATHVRDKKPPESQNSNRVNASANAREEKGLGGCEGRCVTAFSRRHATIGNSPPAVAGLCTREFRCVVNSKPAP